MPFRNVPVKVPFSKSTIFEICQQNMCRFYVNGRLIRHMFYRFQNLPVSCERSQSFIFIPFEKTVGKFEPEVPRNSEVQHLIKSFVKQVKYDLFQPTKVFI